MVNYAAIKQMAKERRTSADKLIALSRNNDPFYMGQPAQVEKAQWFRNIWDKFGARSYHLRRFHYRIISQETPVLKADSTPYENTDPCWQYLGNASKSARYLEYIPYDMLDDRRNGKPVEYFLPPEISGYRAVEVEDAEISDSLTSDSIIPELSADLNFSLCGFEWHQPYHIELWIEKSTENETLIPICQRFHANLVYGLGELSITQVSMLFKRISQYKRPCRIFYISDFDPAGQSMPVAVSRKIEYMNQSYGYDIRLMPIALSQEQCEKYRLPRTPIKESEKRGSAFQERFGEGATELDALEAIHPGELRRIVQSAFSEYFDFDLASKVSETKQSFEQKLEDVYDEIRDNHAKEIQEFTVRYNEFRGVCDKLFYEISGQFDRLKREAETVRLLLYEMNF